jgi:hypothetical protein
MGKLTYPSVIKFRKGNLSSAIHSVWITLESASPAVRFNHVHVFVADDSSVLRPVQTLPSAGTPTRLQDLHTGDGGIERWSVQTSRLQAATSRQRHCRYKLTQAGALWNTQVCREFSGLTPAPQCTGHTLALAIDFF